jgi:hypothetical protein
MEPERRASLCASHVSLSLLGADGKEYGLPRYLSGYDEVGNLLQREAGVTYEQLQDRRPVFDRGAPVHLRLTLENDEQIINLGFNPQAV